MTKKLCLCHKFDLLNPISNKPDGVNLSFQTMNYLRPNNLSLEYQRFPPSGCKNIGMRKLDFVAKTQFFVFLKLYFYFFCQNILQYHRPHTNHGSLVKGYS